MKVLKFKKRIEIDKTIGNIHIETFNYGRLASNSKSKDWTELHCWYEPNCECCPLSWEERGYEGECYDCGCCMAEYNQDYPKTELICMLPNWIKKILLRRKIEKSVRRFKKGVKV